MGGIFKEMKINRKFEYDMFHLSNEIYDRETGKIQDETSEEIFIGFIKDDFENKEETSIPAEKIWIENDKHI